MRGDNNKYINQQICRLHVPCRKSIPARKENKTRLRVAILHKVIRTAFASKVTATPKSEGRWSPRDGYLQDVLFSRQREQHVKSP